MNEDTQLEAMIAELVAEGYEVQKDVIGSELWPGGPEITLDLVASPLDRRGPRRLVVVEVANRRRRPGSEPTLVSEGDSPEEHAINRFRLISKAVRSARPWADFQVRFLDVSADQAVARTLVGTSVFNARSVLAAYDDLSSSLADKSISEKSRTLLIAHEWARWLRMTAYRWPASGREMPSADLRKIQKDLFDAKVILTSPSDYYRTHQSVLATIEGGDVEWDRLAALEGDLLLVARRLAEHVGKKFDGPAQIARRQQPDEVFEFVEHAIRDSFVGDRQALLQAYLRGLRDTYGSAAYSAALGDFLTAINTDWESISEVLSQLLIRGTPAAKPEDLE